jgi:transcriptional regulator with XRE-family HTH domain
MAEAHVDVAALHAALDAARTSRGLSWRELARELGLSPSTLSRLANLKSPDVHAFMAMCQWLNVPAETFRIRSASSSPTATEPELMAELAPLLRARTDLNAEDVKYLQEIIGAAVRRFGNSRRPGTA